MKRICLALTLLLFISLLSGCGSKSTLNPNEPVIISLWHNYGGQMEKTMNQLVDEFNATVGNEKGIIVNITSVSSSSALFDKLVASAEGDPGSSELPNITTGYPKSALVLLKNDKLVDLKEYFTEKELDEYMPKFINEGIVSGKLAVFPTAKSTEVLFLNKTLFDRFSEATGVGIDSLSTFEGISRAAIMYHEWTDSLTPDIPNDGKAFYVADSWFNIAQVGLHQLGDSFFANENIEYSENFKKIWEPFIEASVKGGFAIYDGYSSDLAKTGDIVCSTGSTAGILFYGNAITYQDNTTIEVEYEILPYPVVNGGKKAAIQRGGGMIVTKSTKEKEYASAEFLKWFTAPEQNIKFVSETGYLPVTKKAFESITGESIGESVNTNIEKLLRTAVAMYEDYDFYIPPIFDEYDSLEKNFVKRLKQTASEARADYLTLLETMAPEEAYKKATEGIYEIFIKDR
ncbi:MAG TPA: extracellular solute-binding protein [Clostridiaceae bacterium]|nr:extracellular solute-binding protein [Clostridiaceae bacterium]